MKKLNHLGSENGNNGFILLIDVLADCIVYLSRKLGLTFYDFVNLYSVEILQHLFTWFTWSDYNNDRELYLYISRIFFNFL